MNKNKLLSTATQTALRKQTIAADTPGPILRDFETFLEFVEERQARVGGTRGLLHGTALAPLNARLSRSIDVQLQRPVQKSYPYIDGLYLLARVTGLVYVEGTGSAQMLTQARKPVEKAARRFLEAGELPETTKGSSKKASWPLPDPGLPPAARDRSPEAPLYTPLIEIAMAEEKPDEVLKWYDFAPKSSRGAPFVPLGAIAGALRAKYPDRAVEILQRLVAEQLERADVKAYSAAAESTRMVRETLLENGRDAEWQTYLARIRDENRRRPRCIEILRGLDRRPLTDLL